jgi:CheY-like chemotaxis protein
VSNESSPDGISLRLRLLSLLDDDVADVLRRRNLPVRLPLSVAVDKWVVRLDGRPAIPTVRGLAMAAPAEGRSGAMWRLLIIEDDEDIADSLSQVFSARGYRVEVAGNGQQALDRARASGDRPDAILLDLLMPVMDGGQFLRARATEPVLASTPVIVITAQPTPTDDATPVYARFAKPLPLKQLVEAVYRACHGSPAGGSSIRPGRRAA